MKYKRKKNYWQQDIRRVEYLKAILCGAGLILLVSYLFYGTWMCAILFSPYLIRYINSWEKKTIKKRKEAFRLQFKEAILSMSAALNVGYSMENALREAIKDLKGMYKKGDMILKELAYMARQLQMNVTVESAWQELALRTGDEDVKLFATVFSMAKRSGGDTLEIIRNVVSQLGDKIEAEREISTMLSAKKLEFRVLSIIPFGMIIYLKFSFPDMTRMLYGNIAGIVVMTVCLGIYLFSFEMGKRMVEIEV